MRLFQWHVRAPVPPTLQDSKLTAKNFTATDADIIFAKVKAKVRSPKAEPWLSQPSPASCCSCEQL